MENFNTFSPTWVTYNLIWSAWSQSENLLRPCVAKGTLYRNWPEGEAGLGRSCARGFSSKPHWAQAREDGWTVLVIIPVQTKQLNVSFPFLTFVFLLWFVLQRRLLKCLKSKIGKNVMWYAGCHRSPNKLQKTLKSWTVTLNPGQQKYLLFPKTQNKFIYNMPPNFLLSHEAGENNIILVFIL